MISYISYNIIMDYYSAMRKEWICDSMGSLKDVTISEISQRWILFVTLIYGIYKSMKQKEWWLGAGVENIRR